MNSLKSRAMNCGPLSGKLEHWHKSLKTECIRPLTPLPVGDARRLIQSYVDRYNTVRLHSAHHKTCFTDVRWRFMRRAIVSGKGLAGNVTCGADKQTTKG
jgi:hypothetical protein